MHFYRALLLLSLFLSPLYSNPVEKIDFFIPLSPLPPIATTFESAIEQPGQPLTLILSDGSRWSIKAQDFERVKNEVIAQWKQGDEIRLAPRKSSGDFMLKNTRARSFCCANLKKKSEHPERGSYIRDMDANGYAIQMDDGSEWVLGWIGACTTQDWRVGDRVVINKSDHSRLEDYLLIHPSSKTYAYGSLIQWRGEE